MKSKLMIKNPMYVFLLTSGISLILLLLYYGTINIEGKIEKEMFRISTSDVIKIAQNNAEVIHSYLNPSNDYIKTIQENKSLQNEIEKHLKTLITDNIQYSYILYRDKKGVFRFLVDGSIPSEKAFINQKFDVDSHKWMDVYEEKTPQIIRHTMLQNLSISYLIPILNKEKVELVLAIDFSVKKVENINRIIELMKKGILAMFGILFIALIIFIIQTLRYKAIKYSSFIDTLTNVYNRNYLQESKDFINLNEYILAAIDIDHFKRVNDTYGHDAGDTILKKVAHIMLQIIRTDDDIIVRYGGEEFLIFVKVKSEDREGGLVVLERIFKNVQNHEFKIPNQEHINITISIGVNLVPQKSRNFRDAFKLADQALYRAKNKGRNLIEIYTDSSAN